MDKKKEMSEANAVDLFVDYLSRYVDQHYGCGFEYIRGNQDRTNDSSLSDYLLGLDSVFLLIEFKRSPLKYRTELTKPGRAKFILQTDAPLLKMSVACHFISSPDIIGEAGDCQLIFNRYIPILRKLFFRKISPSSIATNSEFSTFWSFAECIKGKSIGLGCNEFVAYLLGLKGCSKGDAGDRDGAIEAIALRFDLTQFKFTARSIKSINDLVVAANIVAEQNGSKPTSTEDLKESSEDRNNGYEPDF